MKKKDSFQQKAFSHGKYIQAQDLQKMNKNSFEFYDDSQFEENISMNEIQTSMQNE